jgi:hypothetical protein
MDRFNPPQGQSTIPPQIQSRTTTPFTDVPVSDVPAWLSAPVRSQRSRRNKQPSPSLPPLIPTRGSQYSNWGRQTSPTLSPSQQQYTSPSRQQYTSPSRQQYTSPSRPPSINGSFRRTSSLSSIRSSEDFYKFYNNIIDQSEKVPPDIGYVIKKSDGSIVVRYAEYKIIYKDKELYMSSLDMGWFYVYVPDQPYKKGIYNAKNDAHRDGIIGSHYSFGPDPDCKDLFKIHKTQYTIKPYNKLNKKTNEHEETLNRNNIQECNMNIQDIKSNLTDLSNVTCKFCIGKNSKYIYKSLQDLFDEPDSEYIKYIIQLGFNNIPSNTPTNTPVIPLNNLSISEPISISGAILHEGFYGGTYKIKNNKKVYIKKKHKCSKETLKKIYHFIYNKKPKTVKTIELVIHNDGHIVILYHYSNNKVTFKTTTCKTIQEEMKH